MADPSLTQQGDTRLAHAGTSVASRLLTLPTEIRDMILHELLYDDKPLSVKRGEYYRDYYSTQVPCEQRRYLERIWLPLCKRSFSFSPAILQTCRQLYAEGRPILRSNTTTLEVWETENCFGLGVVRTSLLGYDVLSDVDSGLMPPCYHSLLRRIRVVIVYRSEGYEPQIPRLRFAAYYLGEVLRKLGRIRKIDVEISDRDNVYGLRERQMLVDPFGLLRSDEVDLSGCRVTKRFADRVREEMQSPAPAPDPSRML